MKNKFNTFAHLVLIVAPSLIWGAVMYRKTKQVQKKGFSGRYTAMNYLTIVVVFIANILQSVKECRRILSK